jgi:hypothetical protein
MANQHHVLRRILLCIAFMAVVMGIASTSQSYSPAPKAPEMGTLMLEQLPVTYTVTPDGGDFIVSHAYAADSPAAVQRAVQAMRQVAAKWAGEGRSYKATLMFGRPLSIDEFKSFMRESGVVAYSSSLRGLMRDGQYDEAVMPPVWAVGTTGFPLIGTPQPGGDVLDPALVAEFTGRQQRVFGVISTDVILDAKLYGAIEHDSRVYAVDIIQQALTNMVLQNYPQISPNQIHVFQSRLFTMMESAGLTPGKTQP